MDKPQWQKARIINDPAVHPRDIVGKGIWVRAEPPSQHYGGPMADGKWHKGGMAYQIAIKNRWGDWMYIDHDIIELLPEFADDITPLTWEEFLAGGTNVS